MKIHTGQKKAKKMKQKDLTNKDRRVSLIQDQLKLFSNLIFIF